MKRMELAAGVFEIRLLSAAEALACLRAAEDYQGEARAPDCYPGLGEAVAEFGALAAFCLYREGKRAFPSPETALRALTLDELALVYDGYAALEREEGFM